MHFFVVKRLTKKDECVKIVSSRERKQQKEREEKTMTKTMNPFKKRIEMVIKMDMDLLINTDDATYDRWLEIIGNHYDTTMGFTNYLKIWLVDNKDKWNEVIKFYNDNKRA